jgi:F-type H+-transporting ATPase subunit delta
MAAEPQHETVLDAGTARARLARVYAQALLDSALKVSPSAPDAVGDELTALVSELSANPAVARFLSSLAVGKKAKAAALAAALDGRASDLLRGFVGTLAANNRLDLLRGVEAAYRRILNERAGRVPVKVTTAVPLTNAQTADLTDTLKAALRREPVVSARVDPDILGGMIVQVGDSVVDTSVRSRLQSLRTLLLEKGTSHGN